MTRHWTMIVARLVAGSCLLIIVLTVAMATLWFCRGGRLLSVQTGSMTPVFRPGDEVVVRPEAFSKLQVGQIISYRSTANTRIIISHRIIRLYPKQDMLITKGDNLAQPDLAVHRTQVIGQVIAVALGLGTFIEWLHSPIGLSCMLYLPAGYLVGVEIYRYLRQPPRRRYSHHHA